MSTPSPAAKPRTHSITINYNGNRLGPDRDPVHVRPRDSVVFKQGLVPEGLVMQVSFEFPEHFSAPVYRDGQPPVEVLVAPPKGKGAYRCELILEGSDTIQPTPLAVPGGSLEVDTGQGDTN